jgi:hypothetical protein
MIRQIAPAFFSTDIPATLAYYKDKLGFECLGTIRRSTPSWRATSTPFTSAAPSRPNQLTRSAGHNLMVV